MRWSLISTAYRLSWQAAGKNDAWLGAHCGLRQISAVAPPPPAANLATRRLCSHTEDTEPQPRMEPVHRPPEEGKANW
jgi:hypothetical protein